MMATMHPHVDTTAVRPVGRMKHQKKKLHTRHELDKTKHHSKSDKTKHHSKSAINQMKTEQNERVPSLCTSLFSDTIIQATVYHMNE